MTSPRKYRVLVADDEANMRSTMFDILTHEGYEVSTAKDGPSAVQMCADQPFDVVLLDYRMPGLDGIEVFRRIRKNCPRAQVILVSAIGVETLRQFALREGAAAFIDKPFDVEALIVLIAKQSEQIEP